MRILSMTMLRFAVMPPVLSLALFYCLLVFAQTVAADVDAPAFAITPYVQAGRSGAAGQMSVMWAATDSGAQYRLQWRPAGAKGWKSPLDPSKVALKHSPSHLSLATVELRNLPLGQPFDYRVIDGQKQLFQATARAPQAACDTYNFAVFGDCGWGSAEQKALAYRIYKDGVDFAVLTGDIVYHHGCVDEYLKHYFPVYNCEAPSPDSGAPLLRSTLFYAAPGNHDIYYGSRGMSGNFESFPHGLAYFLLWNQPLNGPKFAALEAGSTPMAGGHKECAEFLSEAGDKFPDMASFSFDYGNAHWTILDANPYVDWKSPKRVAWLEADLQAASRAKWRFVAFHQPAFHSGRSHGREQQMRNIAPLMEKYKVDVVFSGHVHNYQRSYPLTFKAFPIQGLKLFGEVINGEFVLDKTFDGVDNTKPNAPIYIVSGCGGAPTTAEPDLDVPERREPFTAKYSPLYSYTRCEMKPNGLVILQIAADGSEIDRVKITR